MATFGSESLIGHEQAVEDFETGGSKFAPYLQFRTGSPQNKGGSDIAYKGGWCITYDNAPEDDNGERINLTDYGWEDTLFVNQDGEEVSCYYKHDIRVSMISMRKGILVKDYGVFPRATRWDEAKKHGNPTGIINVLVVVEGIEHLGPFIITLKGHTQMAFQGSGKQYADVGVIPIFKRTILNHAADVAKSSNLPPYLFWLRLRASVTKNGSPNFYVAGSGENTRRIVVPETFGAKQDIDNDDYYVGAENASAFREVRESAEEWRTEWENLQLVKPTEDTPFDDDDDEDLI